MITHRIYATATDSLMTLVQTTQPRPSLACAHPLESSACFEAFSLVSIAYMIVATTYTVATLAMLKPQFKDEERFTLLWLGAIPFGYISSQLSFVIGGMFGLLTYPHDASPFFYMDWFVMALVLLLHTAYIVGAYRTRAPLLGVDAARGA